MKTRQPIAAACAAATALIETFEPRMHLAATPPPNGVALAQDGGYFQAIVADPARNHVFVGTSSGVIVIDTVTAKQIASIPVTSDISAMALSADGNSIIVALPYAKKIQVISAASLTTQRTMDVGVSLMDVAGGAGGKVYGVVITQEGLDGLGGPQIQGTEHVAQFNLATGAVGPTISQQDGDSLFLRADAAGQRLYVGSTGGYHWGDLAAFDIANGNAPAVLPTITESDTRITDVFDDRSIGTMYIADGASGRVEAHHSNGTVDNWLPTDDENSALSRDNLTGIIGVPGGAFLYAIYNDWQYDSTLVAFSTATGTVAATYTLPLSNATEQVVATANGRVAYIGDSVERGVMDGDESYGIGLVGSQTLQIPDGMNAVSGTIFNDKNDNGTRQSGEDDWNSDDGSDIVSAVIYADLNNNGKLDAYGFNSSTSCNEPYVSAYDATPYRLGLPNTAGTYTIRMMVDPDHEASPPVFSTGAALQTVTLTNGQQIGGVDFGVVVGARVGGYIFADLNGNGVRDESEPSVAGAQIYLDQNRDGQHQSSEPIVTTSPDEDGAYNYDWSYDLTSTRGGLVRLLNTQGYTLTTPSTRTFSGTAGDSVQFDFGIRPQLSMTGTLYRDDDADGRHDSAEIPLAGARIWLDLDGDRRFDKSEPSALADAHGHYTITLKERGESSMPVYVRDTLAQRLVMSTQPRTVTFSDWKQTIARDVGVYSFGAIAVNVFADRNHNRKHNRGEGPLVGVLVFIDNNHNGKLDRRETSAVTDASGNATFGGMAGGDYDVRVRLPSTYRPTTSIAIDVTVKNGETTSATFGAR